MNKKMRKLCKKIAGTALYGRSDWLAVREETARRIAELAENGAVAVIESGMDCDGVQYSGHVHIIAASVVRLELLDKHTNEWADGPYYLSLERPSKARQVEYSSRDLGMEAFENGHPWVLRP